MAEATSELGNALWDAGFNPQDIRRLATYLQQTLPTNIRIQITKDIDGDPLIDISRY
jgi:hypothetical protein